MPTATVTSKGQVTVPKPIRDRLKLHAGDRLDFVLEEEGKVILRKASIPIQELEGILHRADRKPVSLQDMKETVRRRFGARK